MRPLQLVTLGELRLSGPEGDLLQGRRKLLALLGYLALHSPRAVGRGELAALFWGERSEARARQSLRQALVHLRRVLGHALRVDGGAVALTEGAVEVDARLFEADLDEGRTAEAIERWRGDFFAAAEDVGGEAFSEWLEVERARLRRLAADGFAALVQAAMERGDWREASDRAARWVGTLPLDERAYLSWIRALHMSGRTGEALARHAELVARLREELGRAPSPEVERLGEALERGTRAGGATPAGAKRAGPGGARPLRAGSEALFSPDLVGRGDAFVDLTAAWRAVVAGAGGPVIVAGEEGYGKTRLCEEFLRWAIAETPPAFVLRSRAYEAERRIRFAALRDLLAPLGGAPGLGGAPDDVLARVAVLAPSIRERFRTLPVVPAPEQARQIPSQPGRGPVPEADAALAMDLARVLGDVAAETPVIVFMDDFPATDASTRAVLLALARRPPPGVLILLAGETAGLEADPDLREIRVQPDCRWLELGPLGRVDVAAMVGSMLELDAGDRHRLAELVYAEGAGHPFFTVALVAALADEGRISRDGRGRWRLEADAIDGDLPLPADIREAVRSRLDRLSPDARLVAEAAAVLAGPVSPALLESVAGRTPDAFAAAIDELFARRLLQEVKGRETRGYDAREEYARMHEATHDGAADDDANLHGDGATNDDAKLRAATHDRATSRKAKHDGATGPEATGPDGARGLVFAHELLRRAVYDLTNPARRSALHRAAAAALERVPAGDEQVREAIRFHRDRAGCSRRRVLCGGPCSRLRLRCGAHGSAGLRRSASSASPVPSRSGRGLGARRRPTGSSPCSRSSCAAPPSSVIWPKGWWTCSV